MQMWLQIQKYWLYLSTSGNIATVLIYDKAAADNCNLSSLISFKFKWYENLSLPTN